MDDSVKSGSRLEVSVSFGRFENDALSWEKWSSFSPNKYLEEVGSLSTPGSVAQKKAYFEAHYKRIAAKKAEELEQERSMGHVIPSPDLSSKEDCFANSSETDTKFGLSNGEKLVEEVGDESCASVMTNVAIANEAKDDNYRSSEGDKQEACTNGLIDVIASDEENEDVTPAMKCGNSIIEEAKDELNVNVDDPELNVGKDSVLVALEETPRKDSQRIVEKPPERKNGREQTSVLKKENSKSSARNIAQKVTPTKKERHSAGTKKKVVSPATKPLPAATPRFSKSTSASTPISTSQSLKKKVNGSPFPKSNNSVVGESKRAAPTSLHMSLSLGPSNSLGLSL
ncbi:hypothetical protein DH2020_026992 [Rehmannia glutinosa]|uniref:Protein WVD2-like 7 n=1 Tax=Rehmannia glutinosa TaxID=99300 RepID=A0ABR0VVC7_REHGL